MARIAPKRIRYSVIESPEGSFAFEVCSPSVFNRIMALLVTTKVSFCLLSEFQLEMNVSWLHLCAHIGVSCSAVLRDTSACDAITKNNEMDLGGDNSIYDCDSKADSKNDVIMNAPGGLESNVTNYHHFDLNLSPPPPAPDALAWKLEFMVLGGNTILAKSAIVHIVKRMPKWLFVDSNNIFLDISKLVLPGLANEGKTEENVEASWSEMQRQNFDSNHPVYNWSPDHMREMLKTLNKSSNGGGINNGNGNGDSNDGAKLSEEALVLIQKIYNSSRPNRRNYTGYDFLSTLHEGSERSGKVSSEDFLLCRRVLAALMSQFTMALINGDDATLYLLSSIFFNIGASTATMFWSVETDIVEKKTKDFADGDELLKFLPKLLATYQKFLAGPIKVWIQSMCAIQPPRATLVYPISLLGQCLLWAPSAVNSKELPSVSAAVMQH